MQRFQKVQIILTLCTKGSDREELLKKAKLTSRQLDKYLEVLLVKQLITIKHDQLYITERGHEFLANFHRFQH
jgi:predicted transcriptional regulator